MPARHFGSARSRYGGQERAAYAAAGFTTFELGASSYTDIALRDAIKRRRRSKGPRMRASGPALDHWGHCDNNILPSEYHTRGKDVADGPGQLAPKSAKP